MGKPDTTKTYDHGITVTQYAGEAETLDAAGWRQRVQQARDEGYRLVQSEWHHARFDPDLDGQARSTITMALYLEHAPTERRLVVSGDLIVDWHSTRDADGLPVPRHVDASGLRVASRQGASGFVEILTVDHAQAATRSGVQPLLVYDLSVVPPPGWVQKIRQLCDEYGILMMADEVLTCMGRTGKMFAMQNWDTTPDVMTLGKGFGNGFPVTAMLVADKFKDVIEKISASTSYGGNPMACAAALASIEVIEEETLCERSAHLGEFLLKRMKEMEAAYPIIGEVRGLGCRSESNW